MFTEEILRNRAGLHGDYEAILKARNQDFPIKNELRREVLGTARILLAIFIITCVTAATGFGFLIMIL